jgi:hypothetical protein
MSRFSEGYITLADLAQAYRKAKADVFREKALTAALQFAEYEKDLYKNLEKLHQELTQDDPTWYKDIDFIGGHVYITKKLDLPPRGNSTPNHFFSSDPHTAWKHIIAEGRPQAQFRPVAASTVAMHIVSNLWVNKVGHLLDARLSRNAYGSRLQRYWHGDDAPREQAPAKYHLDATGSYRPYFFAYLAWRRDGLKAARRVLKAGQPVVAITMDLKSFYHNIDPAFLTNDRFLERIGLPEITSHDNRALSLQLVQAFTTWAEQLPTREQGGPLGVPVGPAAARVMANALLFELDYKIETGLTPVYYGRYVDDVFLVLRSSSAMSTPEGVLKHLLSHVDCLKREEEGLSIDLDYSRDSRLVFAFEKQHIFHLTPDAGEDLLDAIESRIQDVSSEWRLLPDADDLEKSPAAKVLVPNRDPGEEADSLGRADRLSIRRLGFSIMLRNCDALARDLPPDQWIPQRKRFYTFAEAYVLTPLRFFELSDYVPRLIGLATVSEDWAQATRFIKLVAKTISSLEKNTDGKPEHWRGLRRYLAAGITEAMLRSLPPRLFGEPLVGLRDALDSLRKIDPHSVPPKHPGQLAHSLLCRDLGRIPLKDILAETKSSACESSPVDMRVHGLTGKEDLASTCNSNPVDIRFHDREAWRLKGVKDFLQRTGLPGSWVFHLMFPTRPHSAPEIAASVPQSLEDRPLWHRLIHALRGTWVKDDIRADRNAGDATRVFLGGHGTLLPRIAVTSIATDDSSWNCAADGSPDLSVARYTRLVKLANTIIRAEHPPQYVVFPELCIPRKWMKPIAHHFLKEGISVIAGVEYQRDKDAATVINEAKLFLIDRSLGFCSHIEFTQPKVLPAHKEKSLLRSRFDVSFPPRGPKSKPREMRCYGDNNFRFGVLVCSEMTDVRFRLQFRGKVDALLVLSWNQDIESFESLVESAALDVHCYQVLVNNRRFGDSRVRGPYRKRWQRDLVRIKGGMDDYFVVAELDVRKLREFQSHAEPPEEGEFKPTPEGFEIDEIRRRTPGGG